MKAKVKYMSLSNFVKRIRDIMRNDAGINGDAQRIEQMAWMLFLKVYDTKESDWEFDDDGYTSIIPESCRWSNWAVDDKSGNAMTGDVLLDFVNNTLFPTLKNLDVNKETPIKKSIVKTTFEDANNYMKDGVLLRQIINIIDELDLGDYEESHAFGVIYETILKELQSAGSSGEYYTPRAVTDFMAKMIKPQLGENMADFACGTGGFLTSWLNELLPLVKTTEDQEKFDNSIYGIEKKQFPYMLCITNMLLHGIDVPKIYHDNSLLRDVLDYTEDDQFEVILMNPPYGGNEKAEVKNHFPDDLASNETAELFMSIIMYRLKKNGRAAVILPDNFLFGIDNTRVAIKKKLFSEYNLHTVIRMPHSVFAPYTPITTNILFFDRTRPTEETWIYRLDMPNGYKNFSKTKPMELKHFDPVIKWWENREEIIVDGFDKARKYTLEEIIERNYDIDLCKFPHEEEEILPPKELIQQYHDKRSNLNADIDRMLEQMSNILYNDNMLSGYVHKCGTHFDELSALNASFPEMLKKSILQEAMQGRLVPQNNADESSIVLLEHMRTKKQLLISQGKLKKEKPLQPITDDDIPFEIPESWIWVRLGEVFQHNTGKALNSSNSAGRKMSYITTSNLYWNRFELDKLKEMPFTDAEIEKCTVKKGDLLVCEGGDIGRTAIWHYDYSMRIQNHIHRLRPYVDICVKFFYYVFYLYKHTGLIGGKGIGIQGLSSNAIHQLLFPLPPIAEQERIVEKIEKLMPYCEKI